MGLFKSKAEKERLKAEKERLQKLENNLGLPYTTELTEDDNDSYLAYNYKDVQCSITGDVSGLKTGAAIYGTRNGIIQNILYENIAKIDNTKIIEMINDLYDKQSFCTLRTKFVSVKGDKLYCNMGFYRYTKKGKAKDDAFWNKFMNDEEFDEDEFEEEYEDQE